MPNKICSSCQKEKSLDAFYKQSMRGLFGVRGSCKECDTVKKKEYRLINKDGLKVLKKAEYERNKQKHLDTKKQYRQLNKGKINALVAARKAVIKQRTPVWLSKVDVERIKNEYQLASLLSKLTKEPWHVDHIIPLQGKYVSGLHIPSNLRAIRGAENISKKNKFEVNYA
jgi:phenylalanyl-tRNA synthetase alpha subunit